jgi:hypothetical protein
VVHPVEPPVAPPAPPADTTAQELSELKGKVAQMQSEKVKAMFSELVEKNRGILLPKFDGYINSFAEYFLSKDSDVVKFGEATIAPAKMFYDFVKDIVASKVAIFAELAKGDAAEKKVTATSAERAKMIAKYKTLAEEKGYQFSEDDIDAYIARETK